MGLLYVQLVGKSTRVIQTAVLLCQFVVIRVMSMFLLSKFSSKINKQEMLIFLRIFLWIFFEFFFWIECFCESIIQHWSHLNIKIIKERCFI
jgi:hypothetical protein